MNVPDKNSIHLEFTAKKSFVFIQSLLRQYGISNLQVADFIRNLLIAGSCMAKRMLASRKSRFYWKFTRLKGHFYLSSHGAYD